MGCNLGPQGTFLRCGHPGHVTLLTQKAARSLARIDQGEGPAHVHIENRQEIQQIRLTNNSK